MLKIFRKKPLKAINVGTVKGLLRDSSFSTPMYAKVIEATKCNQTGAELYTLELFFPRIILAEQNTHRVFSRNTGSSRAIPILRMLSELLRTPFKPLFFGANKSGMQSAQELPVWKQTLCDFLWSSHRLFTYLTVRSLTKLGLHKQWGNRLLEPHTYIRQVVTSSDWANYLHLRLHDDAQPEIILLAAMIDQALFNHQPRLVDLNNPETSADSWHLPYVTADERDKYFQYPTFLAKLSAARCARTSYLTQENMTPNPEKEIKTFKLLAESVPIHASPLEHQAFPAPSAEHKSRNLMGFIQYREHYETKEFGQPIVIPRV